MSTDLDDRVSDLLSSVREELESADVPDDVTGDSLEDVDADFELADHAADAREIVESNDPTDILEAVGLGELPDGSEPSSIPEAIARGPTEQVQELHALVTLASLAEWGADEDADELESVLSDLRETLTFQAEDESEAAEADTEADGDEAEAESETNSEDGDGAEAETDTEGEEASAEGEADASGGDEATESSPEEEGDENGAETEDTEAAEADEGSEDDGDDSTVGNALKAAAGTTVEEFSADLEGLRGRLEALAGDDETTDEDESGGAAKESVDDEGETGETAAESADDEDEADEGLLDFGGGLGGDEESGRSSMHSTMPPPPSERADMRAVRRHSTMPDRR